MGWKRVPGSDMGFRRENIWKRDTYARIGSGPLRVVVDQTHIHRTRKEIVVLVNTWTKSWCDEWKNRAHGETRSPVAAPAFQICPVSRESRELWKSTTVKHAISTVLDTRTANCLLPVAIGIRGSRNDLSLAQRVAVHLKLTVRLSRISGSAGPELIHFL